MGLDAGVINFIKIFKPFKQTLTLGRQEILIKQKDHNKYCETMLLELFGSTCVDSVDNSAYQDATIIADMNLPWQPTKQYDTVLDLGTMEHIFNVPQTLENIRRACAVGGQIIHVVPANNFCGHGFYQFSPELFYSYYTKENGFEYTEVYIHNLKTHQRNFVPKPADGARAEIQSADPLYVMVRTIKQSDSFVGVQQSDYVEMWKTE
jgi:hypothetical protein